MRKGSLVLKPDQARDDVLQDANRVAGRLALLGLLVFVALPLLAFGSRDRYVVPLIFGTYLDHYAPTKLFSAQFDREHPMAWVLTTVILLLFVGGIYSLWTLLYPARSALRQTRRDELVCACLCPSGIVLMAVPSFGIALIFLLIPAYVHVVSRARSFFARDRLGARNQRDREVSLGSVLLTLNSLAIVFSLFSLMDWLNLLLLGGS